MADDPEAVIMGIWNSRFGPDRCRAALQDAGSYGLGSMKADSPVRTGYMRDHENFQIISDYEMEFNSPAPYSGYVNGGTIHQRANPFFDRGTATTVQRLVENLKKL